MSQLTDLPDSDEIQFVIIGSKDPYRIEQIDPSVGEWAVFDTNDDDICRTWSEADALYIAFALNYVHNNYLVEE